MSSVVRRMVHDICNSKEDLHEINPDAVVSEVYRQGLMKNFLENLNKQGNFIFHVKTETQLELLKSYLTSSNN